MRRGTSATLRDRRWRRHALLLCYPPPQVSSSPSPNYNPNPTLTLTLILILTLILETPTLTPTPNPDPNPCPIATLSNVAALLPSTAVAHGGGVPRGLQRRRPRTRGRVAGRHGITRLRAGPTYYLRLTQLSTYALLTYSLPPTCLLLLYGLLYY